MASPLSIELISPVGSKCRNTPKRALTISIFYSLSIRWQRGWRQLEQTAERTSREMDIRTELRNWDNQYPEIHHELIVRWVSGALVSLVVTSLYTSIMRPTRSSSRRR